MPVKEELIGEVVSLVQKRLPEDEASQVEEFVRQYYGWVTREDLAEYEPVDLYGAAVAHWSFARERTSGMAKVHVYNPKFEEHGWQSPHTVIEIVNDDMPFLVDSVRMEINGQGQTIHLMIHPMINMRRDDDGRILEVLPPGPESSDGVSESVIHVEVDRRTEPEELESIRENLERSLADVRAAVGDWPEMREKVQDIVSEFDRDKFPVEEEEISETKAFLGWIDAGNFTFLGYREYDLTTEDGEEVLRSVPGSGLGILRQTDSKPVSRSFGRLPEKAREMARKPRLLMLTKANSRSTVHRPSYLDYIGVKRFDESGQVVGERRFLGLYTFSAYSMSALEMPLVRRKTQYVLDQAEFPAESHNEKDLVEILETYPRDELFQISRAELFEISLGVLHLQERQRVRLFVRRDTYGRFLSCLVFVPRDRYNTPIRQRMQDILIEAFDGKNVEFNVRLSESVLARLHFIVYTPPGEFPDYDVEEIEGRIVEAARSWTDNLYDALIERCGEEAGTGLFQRYREALPVGYMDDFPARTAVADIVRIEDLAADDDLNLGMSLYHPVEAPDDFLRFKLYSPGDKIPLSSALPLLENMGVRVIDEHPYSIEPAGSSPVWIYNFGLSQEVREGLKTDDVGDIFQDSFARMWSGTVENDRFNRLVLLAGLTWRRITVLRACCKYLRQTGTTFSQAYMEDTLAANPHVARLLVKLFEVRFDPDQGERSDKEDRLREKIEETLEEVMSLDEDRILRSFLNVMLATVRTNYFQVGPDGEPKPYLSFKLDPAKIPELPLPRPMFEVFVYSPRMEGVHLRGGEVARGGIRWSDRKEDFRTEILGLMKAQTVKNAVILPVGAKGGFVVKQPPAGGDREELASEVLACYKAFIRGLLDLTDNFEDGNVKPPPRVVRHDEDDPYLVVAADKGTATFSDTANDISEEYGFWLGDAFASGGSSGYDHKKMAITARGTWESVERHFRELGKDVQEEDFTVVGVGDMSGDVFGNGMLLSRHIKLVGAFDHRHIFFDPDPDAETSFTERERLFNLPRSTWKDYDKDLISEGGGVFPRTAKSIKLSPQIKELLDVEKNSLPPNEVIKSLLKSPVDLFWNGGIGTYVKASHETHADVGDKSSDALRVDGKELRCRVVGEGGNLGFTQPGRVEYALNDGKIYMDAIDNSAGVDCSDHEVNIKILLDSVVKSQDMTVKQRDELLVEMTEEVARLVLRNNYGQAQAISSAVMQAVPMAEVHARYISALEDSGHLNRSLEFLPGGEEIAERKSKDMGLVAPEFAILLSYTKIHLYDELLDSDVPEDPYLSSELERYFPTPLRERFRDRMEDHRLRREIIATHLANSLVNRCGTTFVYRLGEETGAPPSEISRAYTAAREIFGLRDLWTEIEALDKRIEAGAQTKMLLDSRKVVERATLATAEPTSSARHSRDNLALLRRCAGAGPTHTGSPDRRRP